MFRAAHNAGNDAIANLKVLTCFVLDSLIDDDDDFYDADVYRADVVTEGKYAAASIPGTQQTCGYSERNA